MGCGLLCGLVWCGVGQGAGAVRHGTGGYSAGYCLRTRGGGGCLGPWPGMHSKGRDLRAGPQQRLDGRLEEVAKAVGGGYCRLQMPLSLALAVRGTVAGRPGGGGGYPPPLATHPWP